MCPQESGIRESGESCQVLVVEDDFDSAEVFCLMLEDAGHECRIALNAVEARTIVEDFTPDVALIDIGLPGETVEFRHGRTYINGTPLDEPYIKNRWTWDQDPEVLGSSEYYFVGDNRTMPIGDHTQGKGDRSRIVGRVLL